MRLKHFALYTFLVLIFSVLTACKPDTNGNKGSVHNHIIRIGTADGNGRLNGLFGLARQLGYLDEELASDNYQYKISGFSGAGPAVNEALAADAVDIALYADFPAIIAAAKGIDTQLLMTEDALINANIAVREESNIHSLEELVGKRVALPRGTYMQRYFTVFVEKNGYTLNDFNIIQMTGDAEAALISGTIDAMVWTENSTKQLQHKVPNIKILYSTRTEPNLAGISVVVSKNTFIKLHPKAIEALYKAILRASEYAKTEPQKAEELLAIESNTSVEVIQAIHDFHNPNIFAERYAVKITESDKSRLKQTQKFMVNKHIINHPIDIDKWVTSH